MEGACWFVSDFMYHVCDVITLQGFSLDDDTSDEPAAAPAPERELVAAGVATATADDNNGAAPQPEPFVAAKYSYGKVSKRLFPIFCNLLEGSF
jgi:hypothetical protein